jgi:hypothetical protein
VIDRDSDLHPPVCRRGLLVRPDGSAVDHLDVAIVRGADGVHQPVPYARLSPSVEAVVAGGARAIALRQVTPRCTRAQHPEDAVQRAPVIDPRYASRFVGQQWLDHAPLEVGQIVSAHDDAESQLSAAWKPDVGSTVALQRPSRHAPCMSLLWFILGLGGWLAATLGPVYLLTVCKRLARRSTPTWPIHLLFAPILFAAWWVSCFVVTYADGDQSRGADELGLGIILLPSMIVVVVTLAVYYGSLALSIIRRGASQPQ